MAVLDEDFGTDLTPAESGDSLWSLPMVAPTCEPLDWQSLFEQAQARVDEERVRADVAELRREEVRRAERDACSRARSLERQLDTCRYKLKVAVDEAKELRRAVPSTPKKESRSAKVLERRIKSQDGEIADLRVSLHRSHEHRERIEAQHQDEINWLKKDIDRGRSQLVEASRSRNRALESLGKQAERRLAAARRLVAAREGTIAWLRERNGRLRAAVGRATELIASLREKNARLRAEVRDLTSVNAALASRVETLQAQLDKLRSTRSVLSKALYGSKSERQKKPGTGRKRGQQRGTAGHGRTQRPSLREKKERRNPPKDARVCPRCGKPYAANGERCATLFEIDVEAYENTIVRPRWRRTCECASSPRDVTAPAVARLFDNTPYGISVWVCMLYERFVCCRPLHRVAAWLADMGLTISPGTLADSIKRFVPLSEPLAKAILAHQNSAALRHADETTWRVQAYREKGRSSRAWLWTSVSRDAVYYHIDPSRSAEVAKVLFGSTKGTVVLVCDRLSTYKRLARELDGKVILQWCWAHQRRSFIDCAAGHVRLTRWCRRWIEWIAEIYRLNEARLEHYDPGREKQTPAFDAAQGELKKAANELFANAEAELAGLSDRARRAKPLRSLVNHREGLSVFVDKPHVPPDNNRAELALRGAVIGRRLSFGSDSEKGAKFTAMMYSVAGTLAMNGIDVRRWLEAWLTACAENGGEPPDDLEPWLPWSMSEERRRELTAPG